MSLIVPDSQELEVINDRLGGPLTLRLYSNNVTPSGGSSASGFTEVSGGGYASVELLFANWTITVGDPTFGIYPEQEWVFTGATDSPGSIFGYYVTRDSDGELMFAERFPSALVPFVAEAGSQIKFFPRYSVTSQF